MIGEMGFQRIGFVCRQPGNMCHESLVDVRKISPSDRIHINQRSGFRAEPTDAFIQWLYTTRTILGFGKAGPERISELLFTCPPSVTRKPNGCWPALRGLPAEKEKNEVAFHNSGLSKLDKKGHFEIRNYGNRLD